MLAAAADIALKIPSMITIMIHPGAATGSNRRKALLSGMGHTLGEMLSPRTRYGLDDLILDTLGLAGLLTRTGSRSKR